MSDSKTLTIGQALDIVLDTLSKLDEKSQRLLITTAVSSLGLTAPPSNGISSGQGESTAAAAPTSMAPAKDIRTLKDEKTPKSAVQMACLVAYYLGEVVPLPERKATIKAEDIEKYFKQAQFPLPKNLSQTLIDAKGSGYFESTGRGEYKLNAVGHNLVTHKMTRSTG